MTSRDRAEELVRDLADELEAVLKTASSSEIAASQVPLLQICADHMAPSDELDAGLEQVLGRAIGNVTSEPDRNALRALFQGKPGDWPPLHERGATAAAELDITYDAIRRRNKDGARRLDALVLTLARSLYDLSSLGESLLGLGATPLTLPVSEEATDRISLFLSYSRADDEHEGGVISQLRDRLVAEFRFQTGRDLFVFQDTVGIDLGEHWRSKIETEIDRTSFLLVFLTPSYLRSSTCREELQRFFDREDNLNRNDLVLPVYYADVAPEADDHLAKRLLQRQHVDWRHLRFEPFDSVPVRMALAELSSSIAKAVSRNSSLARREPSGLEVSSEKGLVERLVDMELALPRFPRKLKILVAEQEDVTAEIQEATTEVERLNRTGRGTTGRLIVARRLAGRLEPHADRMDKTARELRTDLDVIEDGLRALAAEVPDSDEEGLDEVIRGLIGSLSEARDASEQASISVEELAGSYERVGRQASTLRPVLNRMITASRIVTDCAPRFSSWIQLLEESLEKRVRRRASI
jgi:hypothetical protein